MSTNLVLTFNGVLVEVLVGRFTALIRCSHTVGGVLRWRLTSMDRRDYERQPNHIITDLVRTFRESS